MSWVDVFLLIFRFEQRVFIGGRRKRFSDDGRIGASFFYVFDVIYEYYRVIRGGGIGVLLIF